VPAVGRAIFLSVKGVPGKVDLILNQNKSFLEKEAKGRHLGEKAFPNFILNNHWFEDVKPPINKNLK
jgi:hypothetical protein